MRTTLEYVHCDLCRECAHVDSHPLDTFKDVEGRAVADDWTITVIGGKRKHICPSCWNYRFDEVSQL